MAQAPSLTRELADFLAGLSGQIDERLLGRATDALIDTLGCMVFGTTQPWSQAATSYALATGGQGSATVIGYRAKTTPAMAAFANGSAAHSFELDDVHEEAISHPGAVVVPAALALAEDLGATTRDLQEAIVIGYEAMGRAGIAVGAAQHMLAGFHPTSMSGVFGSTAAASRLLGFDGELLSQAFGVAVSLACGTMEFAASGGMAKRIHAGRAAEAGLLAASLVARGFRGASDGLAGRYGFCNVFGVDPQVELLTEGLGERWMIDEITVKPYAACSDIHPLIQATIELRAEHQFSASQIERIEAEASSKAAAQNDLDGSISVMAAQYSAQFNIAVAILGDPTDPATYDAAHIATREIADLQSRVVSLRASKRFDATYAKKMGGRVRIYLNNGNVLERTVHGQRGSMHDPLSQVEVDAKFASLVGISASVATGLASKLRADLAEPALPIARVCESLAVTD